MEFLGQVPRRGCLGFRSLRVEVSCFRACGLGVLGQGSRILGFRSLGFRARVQGSGFTVPLLWDLATN